MPQPHFTGNLWISGEEPVSGIFSRNSGGNSGDVYEQAVVKTVAGFFQGRLTYFGLELSRASLYIPMPPRVLSGGPQLHGAYADRCRRRHSSSTALTISRMASTSCSSSSGSPHCSQIQAGTLSMMTWQPSRSCGSEPCPVSSCLGTEHTSSPCPDHTVRKTIGQAMNAEQELICRFRRFTQIVGSESVKIGVICGRSSFSFVCFVTFVV